MYLVLDQILILVCHDQGLPFAWFPSLAVCILTLFSCPQLVRLATASLREAIVHCLWLASLYHNKGSPINVSNHGPRSMWFIPTAIVPMCLLLATMGCIMMPRLILVNIVFIHQILSIWSTLL